MKSDLMKIHLPRQLAHIGPAMARAAEANRIAAEIITA